MYKRTLEAPRQFLPLEKGFPFALLGRLLLRFSPNSSLCLEYKPESFWLKNWMDLCFLSFERSQGIVLPFRNFQLSFLAQISIFNKYLGRKTGYSFKAFKPPTLSLPSYAISKSIPGFSFHNLAL